MRPIRDFLASGAIPNASLTLRGQECQGPDGQQPFLAALMEEGGHKAYVEALLDGGWDPNGQVWGMSIEPNMGYGFAGPKVTPLQLLALSGTHHPEAEGVLRLLLDRGADPCGTTDQEPRPLVQILADTLRSSPSDWRTSRLLQALEDRKLAAFLQEAAAAAGPVSERQGFRARL
jgi:hypothetical protein